MKSTAVLLTLSLTASLAAQTRIYVDDNAPNDPGPGNPAVSDPGENGTLAAPFDAIAEAVAAAAPGDAVVVLDGRYTGVGNRGVLVNQSITVTSENGPSRCTIDCQGQDRAFGIIGSPTIAGFTITGGSGAQGGAIGVLSGFPTIRGCVFRRNLGQAAGLGGGAIYCGNAFPAVENCVFNQNISYSGGGAIALRLGAMMTVTNCSFGGNRAAEGGALYSTDSSNLTVRNSVLWGDTAQELYLAGSTAVTVEYSDVQGGQAGVVIAGGTLSWGAGNLALDPAFVSGPGGDLHLLATSPCIDAGSNALAAAGPVDFEGDPRIFTGTVDMGADEFHPHVYAVGLASTAGSTVIIRTIGPPGSNPVDVFASTNFTTTNPIMTVFGPFYLQMPFLPGFPVSTGPMPANGLTSVNLPIAAGTPAYTRIGLQSLVGSSYTALDVIEVF